MLTWAGGGCRGQTHDRCRQRRRADEAPAHSIASYRMSTSADTTTSLNWSRSAADDDVPLTRQRNRELVAARHVEATWAGGPVHRGSGWDRLVPAGSDGAIPCDGKLISAVMPGVYNSHLRASMRRSACRPDPPSWVDIKSTSIVGVRNSLLYTPASALARVGRFEAGR